MCTVSNEAYTLLLLENNYDQWIDIAYLDTYEMTHKGWKEEEIWPFNALCFIVKQDRLENPNVLT
jgi:hypothetical protein